MLRLNAPLILFGYRIRANGWLRDMHIAFRTLVGSTLSDRQFLSYLSNRADISAGLEEFRSDMPQAIVVDDTVQTLKHDEWRTHFAARLSGRGLEIGPLNRPLETHPGMTVLYLDYADQATLKRLHPALAEAIPPVHIIDDAEALGTVEAEAFDFLVAAHVIEHMRNPLRTLREWLRVLKPGGAIYLVVPDKRRTFDRPRVRTTLEHLILDFLEPSKERDFEHFLDYARFVHRSYERDAVTEAKRLEAEGFSIHFHTFIPADVVAMVRWCHAHVSPVEIAEGPAMSPEADEFHLLLRKPAG